MRKTETDYLIVGAGASGLAFADTLLSEDERAHITLVERRAVPGGHWVDAYPFVTLHQPSAFYGVASLPLGSGRIETQGSNAGLLELATGAELLAYFDRVLREKLLASGRVSWHPLSDWQPESRRIVSRVSGTATEVKVLRKVVDARYLSPSIPATHRPGFAIDTGARVWAPGALARQLGRDDAAPPAHFALLGAGKTAIDTALWLLDLGVPAQSITWVRPRDPWLLNRQQTQPGDAFFLDTLGGQADQMAAWAQAASIDDLFGRLEACGAMLRIDPNVWPTMCHLATVSTAEVTALRSIQSVVRRGRVLRVTADRLLLAQGEVHLPQGTVCIDCTASAVERRPLQPIFQDAQTVLQLVRLPQPTFSAALIAWVSAHVQDPAAQRALCTPVPFPWTLAEYPAALLAHLGNQHRWAQDPALRGWIRDCRLDGFGRMIASVKPGETDRLAIVSRLRDQTGPAVANLRRLAG